MAGEAQAALGPALQHFVGTTLCPALLKGVLTASWAPSLNGPSQPATQREGGLDHQSQ